MSNVPTLYVNKKLRILPVTGWSGRVVIYCLLPGWATDGIGGRRNDDYSAWIWSRDRILPSTTLHFSRWRAVRTHCFQVHRLKTVRFPTFCLFVQFLTWTIKLRFCSSGFSLSCNVFIRLSWTTFLLIMTNQSRLYFQPFTYLLLNVIIKIFTAKLFFFPRQAVNAQKLNATRFIVQARVLFLW